MVERVQKIQINDLKPYARQNILFPDSSKADVDLLAADLQERGLQHPVEILPDHTILCGHRRVQAAQKLGWEEIDVIVREDLAGASEGEIEQHVILDNYARRQLKPLEQARCAQRLRELFHAGNLEELSLDQEGDIYVHTRDRIGQLLGISGRHVSRMMTVLDAPLVVQQAFDDRKLSAESVAKIVRLPWDVKEKIVEQIEQGRDPKKVARQYLRRGLPLNPGEKALDQLVTAIDILTVAQEANFANLRLVGSWTRDVPALLRQCGPLMEALAAHVERREEEMAAALAEKMDVITDLLDHAAATDLD